MFFRDRSAENYRSVSSCSVPGPILKDTTIAVDLLKVTGHLPDSTFAGGLVWPLLLLRVDFVHHTYTGSGSLKPDLSRRPRGHAEMRADRPMCGATRVQRCDLWVLSLFRIIWHGDASPCNALTSRKRRDNVVLRWYRRLVIRRHAK